MFQDKRIFTIALIVFINLLGVGFIWPLLPFYAERLGASIITIGLFAAVYPLFAIISAPLLGILSDKYGRRPILLISLLGTVIGFFLLSIANTLPLLFLARIIDGGSAGNIGTAQAYIADITTSKNRTHSLTFITIAMAVGSLLGPVIGGIFSLWSLQAPAFFAGIISLVALFLAYFFLPETIDKTIPREKKTYLINFQDIKKLIKQQTLLLFLTASLFFQFALWMMIGTLALYTQHLFQFRTQQIGYLFAYDALISVFIQIISLKKILTIIQEKILFVICTIVMTCALFLLGISWSVYILLISITCISLSGIINPILVGLISQHTHKEDQGNAMGVLSAINNFATLGGPILATIVYSLINPRATYYVAGMISVCAVFLSIYLYREKEMV